MISSIQSRCSDESSTYLVLLRVDFVNLMFATCIYDSSRNEGLHIAESLPRISIDMSNSYCTNSHDGLCNAPQPPYIESIADTRTIAGQPFPAQTLHGIEKDKKA